jgi:hypothetical protein
MNATNFERHAYPDAARCLSVIYFFGSISRLPNFGQSVETLGGGTVILIFPCAFCGSLQTNDRISSDPTGR